MNEYTKISSQGSKHYYKDKQQTIRHREDGPAIEWENGDRSWFLNHRLHRIGGPAFATADGYKEWWVDGEFIFSVNEQNNIINRMK